MKIYKEHLPLDERSSNQNLILNDKGVWFIWPSLLFSDLSNNQKLLKNTANAIDLIARKALKEAAERQKGEQKSDLFPSSTAIDSLVDRWMYRFKFRAKRLRCIDFTSKNIEVFFESLERQSANIIGQWDHRSTAQIEENTRKLLDAIFYFGEALFLKNNLPIWGKKLLALQTLISRWPAHFSACQKLEFNPQEVRSLDWLATVCAYILSDYMRIEKQIEFEVFVPALGKSIPYEVIKRFDLVGNLWAFGLLPSKEGNAPPIVLIRGTQKNPFKEGFWGSWWLNANPDFPGASICASQIKSPGHSELCQWMRQQHEKSNQKFVLAGHSIGGAIAIALSICEHQLVERAVVFNAPIYREMAALYSQLIDPPEIFQFQNCRDPICQLQTTDLGHIYHLDSSQGGDTRAKTANYFQSIASILPKELRKPSRFLKKTMQIADCAYRILRNFANWKIMRICLSIEPLPTLGDFVHKLFYFSDSIHRYHSLPSSVHASCLVLKCTPADLNRTELITLRLTFQWMCRTWGFLVVSTALSVSKISGNIFSKIHTDIKVLKNGFFHP